MRSVIGLMAVTWCVLAFPCVAPAHAEKRRALAVGIDTYDNLPAHEQLRKAVNDARAVGAALRELGFETTVEENVPKLAFTRSWQRFLNRLEPGDTAALFFAGHGVVLGGVNYLLPRDVPKVEPSEEKVLAAASIRFNELMDDLREKKVRVPFLSSMPAATTPSATPAAAVSSAAARAGCGGSRRRSRAALSCTRRATASAPSTACPMPIGSRTRPIRAPCCRS